MAVDGIDEKTATELAKYGFSSILSIAEADIESLKKVSGIDDEKAMELIDKAKKHMAKQDKGENESIPDSKKV